MPLDHYVTLGRSGLRASPFALGAMTFGEDPGGAGCDIAETCIPVRVPVGVTGAGRDSLLCVRLVSL